MSNKISSKRNKGYDHIRNLDSLIQPKVKTEIDDFFKNTVKIDYESLRKKISLATTPRVSQLHLMHSVYGHACAGHGEFHERAAGKKIPVQYSNITIDDVIREIPHQNTTDVKRDRQELIDQISEWVYDRIETLHNPGRQPTQEDIRLIKIYRDKGVPVKVAPLAGALMFEHAVLKDFESVLMGFYLGSCMDSYEWREKVDKKFGTTMHKGTTIPVDIFAMKRNGLILEDLQNSSYLTKIPHLNTASLKDIVKDMTAMGIVPKKKVANDREYTSAYLELSKGNGISDDAAFITTSLLFGTEAGFGLLLADAIDTLDKYVPIIHTNGQDELIGANLKKKYESRLNKKFPITDDQVLDFIYLSAIRREDYNSFPSCSQRRFWQTDDQGMTAVQSHMTFLNHIKKNSKYPPHTKIGFKGISNSEFYDAYKNRLDDAMRDEKIVIEKYLKHKKR